MKIVNIDGEILHIFLKSWGISMKFSRKLQKDYRERGQTDPTPSRLSVR